MLLTEDRARPDEYWTRQLPRMLSPLGITAQIACDTQQAILQARQHRFHVAVVDIATPTGKPNADPAAMPGGLALLELLNRLPQRPPVIVVNPHAYSQRQVARLLNQALRLGAFSVINQPVRVDDLLATIARLIQRRYQGAWPQGPAS